MKLFDENGKEVPNEDIAYIALQAVSKLKDENKEKLYEKIIVLANKVADSPIDFGREQAVEVVIMVEHHDEYSPLK